MARNQARSLPNGMSPDSSAMRQLWRRIGFLFGALVVFRIGAHIPVPGINPDAWARIFSQNEDTFLGLFNMFSGGALEMMSIFALGIMPYISASIVIQLMTAVVPTLEQLRKEGESGRRKITQYTRYLTVVLALIQSFGVAAGLHSQGASLVGDIGGMALASYYFVAVTSLVTGTVFLMWLGEQITERGIGNGISMIIFAGIVVGLPGAVTQLFEAARQGEMNLLVMLLVLVIAIAVIYAVVFVERGQRRITVNHARRQEGRKIYAAQQSHLPLKVNMAGVIPAIFASSILLFPASISQWFGSAGGESAWSDTLRSVTDALLPGTPLYILLFTAGIVFFCYFYTALMFNPKDVADNLKKSGAYIPGIRPGEQSARYIDTVMSRLTLIGAGYMSAVCLLPIILQETANVPFYLGGTSLLIVVVVVMDFWAQVNAHMMSTQYEKLMKKSNMKGYGSTGLVR